MVNLDWDNLPFGYIRTDYNVRCYFRNEQWSKPEISDSEHIRSHLRGSRLIGAVTVRYGCSGGKKMPRD
jgi:branched-chain amino acid aminotransferase